VWKLRNPVCKNAHVTNPQFLASIFVEVDSPQPQSTLSQSTKELIEKYVEDVLLEVPDSKKIALRQGLRERFATEQKDSDNDMAIWNACMAAAEEPRVYEQSLASALLELACAETPAARYVSRAIYYGWIEDIPQTFSADGAQLARGAVRGLDQRRDDSLSKRFHQLLAAGLLDTVACPGASTLGERERDQLTDIAQLQPDASPRKTSGASSTPDRP
jgi:hypothetical protein